jgi:glucosamine--fructose-6-phosphate aminotransferase (isomerizing)
MCGIMGYVGGRCALEVVMSGLERLEFTEYDSAGVAILADGGLAAAKRAGRLADLRAELDRQPLPTGTTGIGHVRRATHGAVSDGNAHPHLDGAGRVAVVHNGVIANSAALREELAGRGHRLASDTDTEVVGHLLAEEFSSCGDLAEAMRLVCARLEGAYALAAVHADQPDTVVGAHRGSPLVVGLGQGENFLASDASAFAAHTREAIAPGPGHVVELSKDGVAVTGPDGRPADVRPHLVGGGTGPAAGKAGPWTR